jgi:hypothetical protein
VPTFDQARKRLPKCITGLDLVGQHKTVSDLVFLVQFQVDLYLEGESERDIWTPKDFARCKQYVQKFSEAM